MKIKELKINTINIPFKYRVKHSSAKRYCTESILVTAESKDNTGYGEGCPRLYVTSETIETAYDFFNKYKEEILDIHNLEDLNNWVKNNESIIDINPAAWCSVELALLDLFAKEKKKSIEQLLNLNSLQGEFHYTAILGIDEPSIFKKAV